MQAEQLADLSQFLFPGLEQAQPHETTLGTPGRRLLQWHRALVAPAAVHVVSTVDDHLETPLSKGGGRHPLLSTAGLCRGRQERPPHVRTRTLILLDERLSTGHWLPSLGRHLG